MEKKQNWNEIYQRNLTIFQIIENIVGVLCGFDWKSINHWKD